METGTGVDKGKPDLSLDESDEFDLREVDQKEGSQAGTSLSDVNAEKEKAVFWNLLFRMQGRAF